MIAKSVFWGLKSSGTVEEKWKSEVHLDLLAVMEERKKLRLCVRLSAHFQAHSWHLCK
jgi:hypothetical protein